MDLNKTLRTQEPGSGAEVCALSASCVSQGLGFNAFCKEKAQKLVPLKQQEVKGLALGVRRCTVSGLIGVPQRNRAPGEPITRCVHYRVLYSDVSNSGNDSTPGAERVESVFRPRG